jgi:phosphate transport system substrate-binding protein
MSATGARGRRQRILVRGVRVVAALLAVGSAVVVADARPAQAATRLLGSGSTYVGLAMDQWINQGGTIGVQVDYQGGGSPAGLTQYSSGVVDFAGTEAEFSAMGAGGQDRRGYQYVPDVAGAVAMMYNVDDAAGRKVDYLRLSPRTIARIFTGQVVSWSDPAIAADNADANLKLPDQPITVVYRSGLSGTTALFYDFVANVAPDVFGPWAQANNFPPNSASRIIQLETKNFAPNKTGMGSSDQIAQHIASPAGKWSIGYDEFGYAKVYGTQVARVSNAAGIWQLPYAKNISAALERATLRPDLTQELSGVYSNPNPDTYPISAYSYLVTQCAPTGERPTCKAPYADAGVTDALAKWMRMIACDGQKEMANIGYSPLPPNLSQEMANSIGRMTGQPPEALNASNCANPRLRGDYQPPAAPPDKVEQFKQQNGGGAGPGGGSGPGAGGPGAGPDGGGSGTGGDSGGQNPDCTTTTTSAVTTTAPEPTTAESTTTTTTDPCNGADQAGTTAVSARGGPRVGGGSGETRAAKPVEYTRPLSDFGTLLPLLALVGLILIPTVLVPAFGSDGWAGARWRGRRP